MSEARKLKRSEAVLEANRVFTPGSPVSSYELFAGRWSLIGDTLQVLNQPGQHVALYGERGVGKTSLANILNEMRFKNNDKQRYKTIKINCNTKDTYATVWDGIFRKLKIYHEYSADGLNPEIICEILQDAKSHTMIVIDELDRLEDDDGLSLMSDTIKALSDHNVATTLVLVGVADSIDTLIGDHRSVERALKQIKMPRMSRRELTEIIDKGTARLKMGIDTKSKDRIARLSEGLPYYTHAMARAAFIRAIVDDRENVTTNDVSVALNEVVENSQQTILNDYSRAIQSTRKNVLFEQVLLSCALARKNELGAFTAKTVSRPMSRIMGKEYGIPAFARHLDQFSSDDRGNILLKLGEKRRFFYRFANPMMQPYVILKGLSRSIISDKVLKELQGTEGSGDIWMPAEGL